MTDPTFTFLPLGALLQSFTIDGTNIVQGFPTQEQYISTGNPPFFGETIGRVANRIVGSSHHSPSSVVLFHFLDSIPGN
jgi:aldose 1-epimerase